ncbi:hypothetical protein [Cutibacterium acnes]|nr:hypothetical protein HMPREF9587_02325 [Cutibacterium acnes HL025PA1]EGR91009.1 conserved domain protein [Propionibacterium sp. CC003-HC2]
MPEWPGEVGENPTLTRNRDHACVVWESEYQERRGGMRFRRGLRGQHRR